jgi:hypothetical protein
MVNKNRSETDLKQFRERFRRKPVWLKRFPRDRFGINRFPALPIISNVKKKERK